MFSFTKIMYLAFTARLDLADLIASGTPAASVAEFGSHAHAGMLPGASCSCRSAAAALPPPLLPLPLLLLSLISPPALAQPAWPGEATVPPHCQLGL
jgi:hypothetical protein